MTYNEAVYVLANPSYYTQATINYAAQIVERYHFQNRGD